MAYYFGVMIGKLKRKNKFQKKIVGLISNAERDSSCRVLFKTLNMQQKFDSIEECLLYEYLSWKM
jgi:hypothetical protein